VLLEDAQVHVEQMRHAGRIHQDVVHGSDLVVVRLAAHLPAASVESVRVEMRGVGLRERD